MLTGVAPYPATNASVRARLIQWVDRLDEGAARLVLGTADPFGTAPRRLAAHIDGPLLLLRNAAKISRGALEANLLRAGRPGVYDLDDGLPWDDGNLPDLGAWFKRPWPRSLIARRAACAADRVIAGNELLADWASEWCTDVVVIPTCVDPAEYRRKAKYEVSDPPRIGWIGTPATEIYLREIAPALAEINRRCGARLTILSGPIATPPELAPFTDRVEWSMARQYEIPATWDVGIMPLREGVYERSKCAYKMLQYGAAGLPIVGSPVGVNAKVIPALGGSAASSLGEWIEALESTLHSSKEARQASGSKAEAEVAASFSFDAWDTSWRAAVGIGC